MEFSGNKPIYLQIADLICDQILRNKRPADDRIPSVREMAVDLEVNPNTVLRTFNYLQEQEVIYNKRGLGYFVSAIAYDKILQQKKQDFLEKDLPKTFRLMNLLKLDFNDLHAEYQKFKAQYGDYHE